MTDQTHEGWTNRETWLVNLWLNNDAGLYEGAKLACEGSDTLIAAGDALREAVGTLVEITVPALHPFHNDLVQAALARVSWEEIAGSFRES